MGPSGRRRGMLAFVGESSAETPINVSQDMLRKGLILYGSWHYNMKDAHKIMQVISRVKPALDKFITHHFPLSQIQQAWETQATGNCGKVIVKPWA